MATSNKAIILKKYAGRTKEKILQNLGRVDRTADEIFDEHLNNFTLQQNAANRLQKEFNNYIRCIRAAQSASKTLMEAMTEVYEPQWSGAEALYAQASAIEVLWQDFSHKLGDQVLIPLNTYTAQFPEMRKKIDKRGRKLVDYDGQRHSFQNLQANAAKRKDDIKLQKGRDDLEEAKRTYEILNSELHDELPALHDSRILFLVTNLQTLFASEQMFHNESSKIYAELEAIVDKLATESQRGSYTLKKLNSPMHINNQPQVKNIEITNAVTYSNGNATPTNTNGALSSSSPTSSSNSPTPYEQEPFSNTEEQTPNSIRRTTDEKSEGLLDKDNNKPTSVEETSENFVSIQESIKINDESSNNNNSQNNISKDVILKEKYTNLNQSILENSINNTNGNSKTSEDILYDIPVGATTNNLPPGVLYRVKATYRYIREDTDELSFEAGDIIDVIEYEDPEDQEEGWLMGIKEGTSDKGIFPANFTKPV